MLVARVLEAVAPQRMGRPFRWVLASSWVSSLGDGFAIAAGPLLVASRTHDPTLVALATLLQRLPWLLLGLPAGVVADRHDRVRVVAVADGARAGVLAVLAVCIAAGHAGVAVVLAALALVGTAEVFSTTAFTSLLPDVVDRGDLTVANARLSTGLVTVFQLVGPPVGAGLFALAGPSPFVGQAALVVAGVLLVLRVRQAAHRAAPPEATGHFGSEALEGVRWVARHPAVRTLALVVFAFNVTFGTAWAVLVLWASERLHVGAVGFGLLTTAGAVGGIAGTLGYGWLTRRVSLGNIMRAGLIFETLTHLAFALTTSQALALAIMVGFGAHAFVWGTTSTTVRQRAVPQEMQGRASSVNSLGSYAGLAIGAAISGPIASEFGITAPFWFAFAGSAALVVVLWQQLRHIAHDPGDVTAGGRPGRGG